MLFDGWDWTCIMCGRTIEINKNREGYVGSPASIQALMIINKGGREYHTHSPAYGGATTETMEGNLVTHADHWI